MTPDYTHSLYIGRFQPFHLGHAQMLAHALQVAQRCIVVIGSAHQAATPKNPFDWAMRAQMIRQSLTPEQAARVDFIALRDYYDGDRWARVLREAVHALAPAPARVALISHYKDASSAYLKWFPEWETVAFGRQNAIDATPLRTAFYDAIIEGAPPAQALQTMLPALPAGTRAVLTPWAAQPGPAHELSQEWKKLCEVRQAWSHSPYAPIFVSVDCVVTCQEHVLLIERDRRPGAGLMALPGGFLEEHEHLQAAALRELREETGLVIDLDDPDVRLDGVRVFDHPQRSERGRVITHAYAIRLNAQTLPDVQGGDDARSARWVPIGELCALEPRLHNDHFHILDTFLGLLDDAPVPAISATRV